MVNETQLAVRWALQAAAVRNRGYAPVSLPQIDSFRLAWAKFGPETRSSRTARSVVCDAVTMLGGHDDDNAAVALLVEIACARRLPAALLGPTLAAIARQRQTFASFVAACDLPFYIDHLVVHPSASAPVGLLRRVLDIANYAVDRCMAHGRLAAERALLGAGCAAAAWTAAVDAMASVRRPTRALALEGLDAPGSERAWTAVVNVVLLALSYADVPADVHHRAWRIMRQLVLLSPRLAGDAACAWQPAVDANAPSATARHFRLALVWDALLMHGKHEALMARPLVAELLQTGLAATDTRVQRITIWGAARLVRYDAFGEQDDGEVILVALVDKYFTPWHPAVDCSRAEYDCLLASVLAFFKDFTDGRQTHQELMANGVVQLLVDGVRRELAEPGGGAGGGGVGHCPMLAARFRFATGFVRRGVHAAILDAAVVNVRQQVAGPQGEHFSRAELDTMLGLADGEADQQ